MSDFDDGLAPIGAGIAEIAADPEGLRWARDCAWMPGTGHCRNRPCHPSCLFRRHREVEVLHLTQARRQRRRAHRSFVNRMARPFLLLLFCCLLGLR